MTRCDEPPFVLVMPPGNLVANEWGMPRMFETREAAIDYAGPRLESEGWMLMAYAVWSGKHDS